MFDWMLPENHAIAILKKDHDTVKGLFEEFEKAETRRREEKDHRSGSDRAENSRHPRRRNLLSDRPRACRTRTS